jgi:helix-turn-helix protein
MSKLNFDDIIQSYDKIMEKYKNMDIDFDNNENNENDENYIETNREDENIKFYVDHIIQAKKINVEYFLPEDLPFDQIVQILESVQEAEDKEKRQN